MASDARELEGKTAIVTGGAKGLGRAITELFVQRGARLAVIDIDAAALSDLERSFKGSVTAVPGDIRRQPGARAAVAEAAKALGHVDILINNAGVYPRKPIFEIDDETWDFVFDVNLRGMYHVTAATIPLMQSRKSGRVVSIASIDAYIPYPKNAHYSAAKAGVISFTKSFAAACAEDQILVNAVSPGAIATQQLRDLGILADIERGVPIGRAADASDIAEVVGFLASDRNRYMTGETVIASGGILMY
ncbi:MAG: SDR family NAD(P)-dependent oxidoreductase [Parvibaculaceae bacterium]